MKIPLTLQPLIDAVGKPNRSLVEQLRVGQTVSGKVLDQVQPGLLRLQLASTVLLARTQVALQTGTLLKLEVTKPYPLPELKILRPLNRGEIRDQVVRTALPRQLAPSELRAGLATLRGKVSSMPLNEGSSPLARLARIASEGGVQLHRLSPAELQRALSHSGLFHEAKLASGSGVPGTDIKFQLLQLFDQLRNRQAPAERGTGDASRTGEQALHRQAAAAEGLMTRLLRLVEGSIARLQLQQAVALPQDDPQRQAWQLDLPIHFGDETQDAFLRIEREANAAGQDGDPAWAVTLKFNFDTIGHLQCRIALAGNRLSTTIWCDDPTTLTGIETRLPSLRQAFEAQGFEVVHLAGMVGEPSEPLPTLPMADGLLDERA